MASDLGDFLRFMASFGILSAGLPTRLFTLLRHDCSSYPTTVV